MFPPARHTHRTYAADERSVAKARWFVRETLDEWGARDITDSAVLAVSELVTNAVVHAGTPARLNLRLDPDSLRVEVQDLHPHRALPLISPQPAEDAEHGRGLQITSALASTWGVEYTHRAKMVWLEFERAEPAKPSTERPPRPDLAAGRDVRVAVIEVSVEGDVTAWNGDAALMLGWAPEEAVGLHFDDLLDLPAGERSGTEMPPRAPGRRWQGSYTVQQRSGSSVEVFASHVAPDRGTGSVVLLVPLERRALLEHPAQQRGSAVAEPDPVGLRDDDTLTRLGLDDYLTLAVERARDRLGADASYLLLSRDLDLDFEVRAVSGLDSSVRGTRLGSHAAGGTDPRNPLMPSIVPDLSARPVPLLAGTGLRSLLVVPVVADGRITGALGAAWRQAPGSTDSQSATLQKIADTIATAADRARLQASERERRDWLTFLAEAGDLLGGSLDQEMTMAITGQIVVPQLATWCAVHLDDERGRPILEQVWHEDERLGGRIRAALEGIEPGQVSESEDPRLQVSVLSIPLVARGRRIGALTLGRPIGDPLAGEGRLVAESVARRAAVAIDNARAHGDLQAVGRALQRSLLPSSMPYAPDLEVGVVYEAAGEGRTAGGDFYDLFPTGGGRWCFVVGDVCGTGAEAAAVTGLARHTIRALLLAGFPVAATLERLNAAILGEGERSRFLTLVCGTLELEAGRRVRMSLVSAGHPPPFVVQNGNTVRQIGQPQPLLGVLDNVAYTAEDHLLERGDLLVAVTDGVLERRDGNRMLGEDGLMAELSDAGQLPAPAVAERVRRRVVEFADQPHRDDIAILVIRMGPP